MRKDILYYILFKFGEKNLKDEFWKYYSHLWFFAWTEALRIALNVNKAEMILFVIIVFLINKTMNNIFFIQTQWDKETNSHLLLNSGKFIWFYFSWEKYVMLFIYKIFLRNFLEFWYTNTIILIKSQQCNKSPQMYETYKKKAFIIHNTNNEKLQDWINCFFSIQANNVFANRIKHFHQINNLFWSSK